VRSAVISAGALLVLIMLLMWVPLDMPIKFTLSWIKGAQTIEATSVSQLEEAGLRIGDSLKIHGTGMCSIHSSGNWNARQSSPFAPFDCSQIIWNDAPPLPCRNQKPSPKRRRWWKPTASCIRNRMMILASARRCVRPFRNQAWSAG
jgi:hypothetical protein